MREDNNDIYFYVSENITKLFQVNKEYIYRKMQKRDNIIKKNVEMRNILI